MCYKKVQPGQSKEVLWRFYVQTALPFSDESNSKSPCPDINPCGTTYLQIFHIVSFNSQLLNIFTAPELGSDNVPRWHNYQKYSDDRNSQQAISAPYSIPPHRRNISTTPGEAPYSIGHPENTPALCLGQTIHQETDGISQNTSAVPEWPLIQSLHPLLTQCRIRHNVIKP